MEPTEGLIPTPTAVTVRRVATQTGIRSIHSRGDGSRDNEWCCAAMRDAM